MNNELLIIDGEKAYRCVDHNAPRVGETFLSGGNHGTDVSKCDTNTWIHKHHPEAVRPILEEVPSPYILREGVDDLVLAAERLLAVSPQGDFLHIMRDDLAAALEPFQSPPEVQERWEWRNDGVWDRHTETYLHGTEIAAALNANELSGRG